MIAELVETDVALVRRRECVNYIGRLQDTEQSGKQLLKYVAYVIRVLFDIDVGGSLLVCHVGGYIQDYTASRHKNTSFIRLLYLPLNLLARKAVCL
jgi:hypothetical protein